MTATTAQHSWETESVEETRRLGEVLGRSLSGGMTIGLVGSLGSGKTQLVKGIAVGNALEDAQRVTSPTFTLVHEYPGRFTLFHADVYRLDSPRELAALGFDEWINDGSVVVVEWADRVRSVMPSESLWIELSATGESSRKIECEASGEIAMSCLAAMRSALH